MRRWVHSSAVIALACAACGGGRASSPPPQTPSASVAPSSAAPGPSASSQPTARQQKFTGTLRADRAVPLTDDGATVRLDEIDKVLAGPIPAAFACLTGAEKKTGRIWLVGRVAASGALEALRRVESSATEAQTKCVVDALGGLPFGARGKPLAISVTLRYAPVTAPGESPPPEEPAVEEQAGGMTGLAGLLGPGGWGRGTAIGLDKVGTLGRGTGSGQGFGSGHGRLGGAHGKAPSTMRAEAAGVAGRLPPEVIQRIVRRQYARFITCHESGLRTNPKLAGRVTIDFTIGVDGKVTKTSRGKNTDLADAAVVACVLRTFAGISFPKPEGGVVRVSYPLIFQPSDESPEPRPPPITVQKRKVASLDGKSLEAALDGTYRPAALVATGDPSAAMPFVLFVRQDSAVYAVRRVHKGPDFAAATEGIERFGPDDWGLRVEGEETQRAGEILDFLID